MAEGLPRYGFFAERLRDHSNHNDHFDAHFWRALSGDSHL